MRNTRRERTHLDAADGSLLRVDDDGMDVSSEDRSDGDIVLGLDGLAEVDNSSLDTWVHGGELEPREERERDEPGKVRLSTARVSLSFASRSDSCLSAPAWRSLFITSLSFSLSSASV